MPEVLADTGKNPQEQEDAFGTVEYWDKEFQAANKWFQKYHSLARKVEKAYLLEQESGGDDEDISAKGTSKYNLFWSNIETMIAALFGRIPKVEVDRTNLDPNDDVARVAALILERIFNLEYTNIEDSPFYIYQEVIRDRLIPGMGIAWARYQFTESSKTVTPQAIEGQPAPQPIEIPIITEEMAPLDYVNWEDFRYSPCKRWQDRRWTARRVPMDKSEVAKRFDKAGDPATGQAEVKLSELIPYSLKSSTKSNEDPDKARVENQADIWEVWNLSNKCVYWYVPGYKDLLDHRTDPLKLSGFWPCKRPLFATMLSKKCLPRPDYIYAKSQYAELNLVSNRCRLLTEALRVAGLYDKANPDIASLLNAGVMNKLLPVDNWAMFAEKGGIKGAIDWFPLEMVIDVLEKLTLRKAELVQEVYQVLGISDIQRGMAMTKETATTQRLKAQFGTARTDTRMNEIARFITDHTRLRAEIICRHWQPETIMARSQIDKTPDAQFAQEAIAMLKTDPSVVARLTVAADSVAAPDWDLEKQQRIDFLQAISQFIGMAQPLIEADPSVAPFIIQIMQWAATGFKGAKQIEGVLDQAYQAFMKKSQMPKQPSATEKKDQAAADKTVAEAKQTNLESMGMLAQAGLPVQALEMVPPATPGAAPGGPGLSGMAPPASIPPSIPRPGVN